MQTIPNHANLCGKRVYQQVIVLTEENALGAIVTRRGDLVLGR